MEIQAAILLVIIFFLMLAFSVPVSYSIIISALVTIVAFLTPGFGVFVSAQKMVSGIDSFSLIAVPFFILAGLLMSSGGIARRQMLPVMQCSVLSLVPVLRQQLQLVELCSLLKKNMDMMKDFQQQ